MKSIETHIVTIHLGLREMYTSTVRERSEVYEICQNFVNVEKSCVTIIPCDFVYTNGNEPGVKVEFIQYPRFPKPTDEINKQAIRLARRLMEEFKQFRVSVTTPTNTYMLENETFN